MNDLFWFLPGTWTFRTARVTLGLELETHLWKPTATRSMERLSSGHPWQHPNHKSHVCDCQCILSFIVILGIIIICVTVIAEIIVIVDIMVIKDVIVIVDIIVIVDAIVNVDINVNAIVNVNIDQECDEPHEPPLQLV